MLAHVAAATGDPDAERLIVAMSTFQPVEAEVMRAFLADKRSNIEGAVAAMERAMKGWQSDPWPLPVVMKSAIRWIRSAARRHPKYLPRFVQMLRTPAAVRSVDSVRSRTYFDLALMSGDPALCVPALEAIEPNVPWDANALDGRKQCYAKAKHALAEQAADDLATFLSNEPVPLQVGIR